MNELYRFVLEDARPAWSIDGAYDIPYLFRDDPKRAVDSLCRSLHKDRDTLRSEVFSGLLESPIEDGIPSIVAYEAILEELHQGSLDNIYTKSKGYNLLLPKPGLSNLQTIIIDALRLRVTSWLSQKDPRLELSLSEDKGSPILFEETRVIDEPNFVGFGPNDQLGMIRDSLEYITHLLEKNVLRPKARHPEEEPEPITKEDIIRPQSLEELTTCLTDPLNQIPVFSSFWMAPPPISPTDIYSMSRISSEESALVLDAFLDLYYTEMLVLSYYFLLKRTSDLWTKKTGARLESALYNVDERQFLEKMMRHLSDELAGTYSVNFLATEGISLGGSKLMEGLNQTISGGDSIINLDVVFKGQLELVRNSYLALERLRISLLYGREHPSYVGDDFLSSFLSLFYRIQQIEASFDSILAVVEPVSAMTLPEDEEKITTFLDELCDRIPGEAEKHNIKEPKLRKGYRDLSPMAQKLFTELNTDTIRSGLGNEGIIESERGVTDPIIFSIIESMWDE
jgi:hypothetical protein